MESEFCVSALNQSLHVAKLEIFNTDQGSQFTNYALTWILKEREIAISMDGRGRALDNIFVERLWRSVKYEDVYIRDYETVPQAIAGLVRYFKFHNRDRLYQSLNYKNFGGSLPPHGLKNNPTAIHLLFAEFLSRQSGVPHLAKSCAMNTTVDFTPDELAGSIYTIKVEEG